MSSKLNFYIAGQGVLLGYWLLGSPYPVLLALAGALACLIPVVGAALAVILPILVGLLTSAQLSLLTALYALAVVMALGIWVKPRLFNRGGDNAILTVILLIALAEAFGLVGIILAPPLSVVCQILWGHLVSHRSAAGAAADVADLKDRQAQVWANIQAMDESPLPLVTSSMARLTALIDKAKPILQAARQVEPAARVCDRLRSRRIGSDRCACKQWKFSRCHELNEFGNDSASRAFGSRIARTPTS